MAAGATPAVSEQWSDVPASAPGEQWNDIAPGADKKAEPPTIFQRVTRAMSEANPLAVEHADKPQTAKEAWEELKQTFAPGEGHYGNGHPLNLVHAIPVVGPGIADALSELKPSSWPEALGHMIGMGASGTPEGPAPIGPARVAPEIPIKAPLKAAATGALRVAAESPVLPAVGAGVGLLKGGTMGMLAGGLAGERASAFANRILGRIQHSIGKPVEAAPVEAAAEVPVEASRIVTPEGEASTPRSPERQAVVDELNKQPGRVAQPSNTVTAPETAEAGPAISGRESANRTALAKDLAEFLHSNGEGISHADAMKMGPDQWKLARSAVRQAGKASTPSPATVQLALEHLKDLEAGSSTPSNVVPIRPLNGEAGALLKGRSLDLAKQLAAEMGQ